MKKIISAVISGLLLIGVIAGALYWSENYDEIYYTKIDNAQMQVLPAGEEQHYEYNLKSCNESGKSKKFRFKASKELRQDAYLKLEIRITGVYKWEEVQFDELPEQVQEKLE